MYLDPGFPRLGETEPGKMPFGGEKHVHFRAEQSQIDGGLQGGQGIFRPVKVMASACEDAGVDFVRCGPAVRSEQEQAEQDGDGQGEDSLQHGEGAP